MLALEECVEVHALKQRGWSISAIARHLDRDRKTVRAYLSGVRVPGERVSSGSDPFDEFEVYVRQRLSDDPHVWASALFDEVAAWGYAQSYVTFARKVRNRRLRPSCGACAGSRGRATAVIDHPPGEEVQWDWLELSDTPWQSKMLVLVGVLSHSGRFRAWITSSADSPSTKAGVSTPARPGTDCSQAATHSGPQRRPGFQPRRDAWRERQRGYRLTSLNEGRGFNPGETGSGRRFRPLGQLPQRRPGFQPRRDTKWPAETCEDARHPQRRPGFQPRRDVEELPVHPSRSKPSTKAGVSTPARRGFYWAFWLHGLVTPQRRPGFQPRRDIPQMFDLHGPVQPSTKAGVSTPARPVPGFVV